MQINISIVLAPPYPASCIRHCYNYMRMLMDGTKDEMVFSMREEEILNGVKGLKLRTFLGGDGSQFFHLVANGK